MAEKHEDSLTPFLSLFSENADLGGLKEAGAAYAKARLEEGRRHRDYMDELINATIVEGHNSEMIWADSVNPDTNLETGVFHRFHKEMRRRERGDTEVDEDEPLNSIEALARKINQRFQRGHARFKSRRRRR